MPWSPERIARLCLGSFSGFGSHTLRKLFLAFPSPEKAWLASPSQLAKYGISSKIIRHFAEWRATVDPSELVQQLLKEQITVIFKDDPTFPQSLGNSSDPPEILFVRGDLQDVPSVAFVGTRRFTSYGKRCVELLVPNVARAGLGIVSGLALGIDALAHEVTLQTGGYTIAVLGTGIDDASLYPRENYALAQRILEAGGAIISEFPPGTSSRKENFPIRNRIIATLTAATVVVEGAPESGSMITAKCALEENREVLAVPGPIWSETSQGTNQLLKLGAKPCTKAEDVLEALALDRPDLIAQARALLPMDPQEERLLGLLKEPRHVDELGRELDLPPASVSSQLSILELKGLVKSIGGQMWVK